MEVFFAEKGTSLGGEGFGVKIQNLEAQDSTFI